MSEVRKTAAIVHIQERTEEAETLDFAISFFEDETEDQWYEKLTKFANLAEKRRAYNNARMQEEYMAARKAAIEAKAQDEHANS